MHRFLQILIMSSALLVAAGPAGAEEFAYDVVIRNGRLLDGLGNPWLRGCIAVKDGRIAALGRIARATGGARSMRATAMSRRAGST